MTTTNFEVIKNTVNCCQKLKFHWSPVVDIGRLYIIVAATTSIIVVTNILIAPEFEHEVSSDAP